MTTRRRFLSTSAAAVVGMTFAPRLTRGMAVHSPHGPLDTHLVLPLNAATRRSCPADWLSGPPLLDQFHALAHAAMDAATQRQVEFADIRLIADRSYMVSRNGIETAKLSNAVGYSVRARIRGTWSVKHGVSMTTDAVVAATRDAIDTATATSGVNAAIHRAAGRDLAPAPVVTGTWRGPCEIDPFTVPFDDSIRLLRTWSEPSERFGFVKLGGVLAWHARTWVFASTAGSLVTQELTQAMPTAGAGAWLPDGPNDIVTVQAAGIQPVSGGYEVALLTDMPDRFAAAAEEAIRLRQLPGSGFSDVGRYPIAFVGDAWGDFVGNTLNPALDGDRVTGIEADASGRSFLGLSSGVLGAPEPTFSPLLTVRAHRAAPSVAAVQWDDDGVVPDQYTLVDCGRVVDCHTTRETAPALAEWYGQRGTPLHSHGCAVVPTPTSAPMGGCAHLTVAPSAASVSLDDLSRDMRHGFVIRSGSTDASPLLSLATYRSGSALEIRNGKPVARVRDLFLSLATKTMLNAQLVAVGDAGTLTTQMIQTQKGMPWQQLLQPVTTPAVLCKDVVVVMPYEQR